jgi:serine protease Do
MRALTLAFVLSSFIAAGPMPARAQVAPARPAQLSSIDTAIAKVEPSLVRIHVVSVEFQDGREVKREASGSGTIISPEGFVLTNHHVAGRTRAIICTLADREEMPAKLVGTDPLSDIAILKLQPPKPRTFPAARFGDSAKLEVGQRVLALGSPLALSQSVTMGIVSNTAMILPGMFWPFNRMTLDGEDVGSIVRWIGHDAAIFGGNSGGPLVNLAGEIVGVNEISLGLAGAIPSNLAREVADAIIRDGKVTRSWIGLEVQPLLQSSTEKQGALVGGTIEGSPAEKAGLASGDILLKLGAQPVLVRFAEEVPLFNQAVMRLPIGKPVQLTVRRGGETKTFAVTPIERESVEAPTSEVTLAGITASDLTTWSAKELNRKSVEGVRVRGLRAGGPADQAQPSLRGDDVIVEVDGKPTPTLKSLEKILDGATTEEKESVPLLVAFERGGQRMLTVIDVAQAGLQDPGLEARKAWVPVSVQVVTRELAQKLGLGDAKGVRVTEVLGTAAESAGLKVGDVITAIDGDPVEASQPSDAELFGTMIRQYKIGSTVQLSLLRGGVPETVKVTLETSPRLPREMKKYEDPVYEFRVRDIAAADRLEEGLDASQRGVLVDAVREGGWAALAHLAVGDLLVAIDGEPVADVEAVQAKMTRLGSGRPATVVFRVKRGIRTFFVELNGM